MQYNKILVVATANVGKVNEIRELLKKLPLIVQSSKEIGFTKEIIEDAGTFEGNALKKARSVFPFARTWTIADDSGLCIDALGGLPGVYSGRWAGNDRSQIVSHTLQTLQEKRINNRNATFVGALALITPDASEYVFFGKLTGHIVHIPRGGQRVSLPYDTIFQPEGSSRTFAEMSDSEKNKISHRGKAFQQLILFLTKYL